MAAQSNKGMGQSGRSRLRGLVVTIEQPLAFEQRAHDIEQSIADGAERSCMTMTTAAQLGVALFAGRIMLDGNPAPMMYSVLQPLVAGMASQDDATLATAASDRCLTRQHAQYMVVSLPQRLAGLGQQRGDGDPPEPWHGSQDRYVALLANLPRLCLRIGLDCGTKLVEPKGKGKGKANAKAKAE